MTSQPCLKMSHVSSSSSFKMNQSLYIEFLFIMVIKFLLEICRLLMLRLLNKILKVSVQTGSEMNKLRFFKKRLHRLFDYCVCTSGLFGC